MVVQAASVAIPLLEQHFFSDTNERINPKLALLAVLVLAASFPLIRQSLLLSDTVTNKFYHSKGYSCPGVNLDF